MLISMASILSRFDIVRLGVGKEAEVSFTSGITRCVAFVVLSLYLN